MKFHLRWCSLVETVSSSNSVSMQSDSSSENRYISSSLPSGSCASVCCSCGVVPLLEPLPSCCCASVCCSCGVVPSLQPLPFFNVVLLSVVLVVLHHHCSLQHPSFTLVVFYHCIIVSLLACWTR